MKEEQGIGLKGILSWVPLEASLAPVIILTAPLHGDLCFRIQLIEIIIRSLSSLFASIAWFTNCPSVCKTHLRNSHLLDDCKSSKIGITLGNSHYKDPLLGIAFLLVCNIRMHEHHNNWKPWSSLTWAELWRTENNFPSTSGTIIHSGDCMLFSSVISEWLWWLQ